MMFLGPNVMAATRFDVEDYAIHAHAVETGQIEVYGKCASQHVLLFLGGGGLGAVEYLVRSGFHLVQQAYLLDGCGPSP